MSVSPIQPFGGAYTGLPAYPAAAPTTARGFPAAAPSGGFFQLASGTSTFLASMLGGSIYAGTSGSVAGNTVSVSSYSPQAYDFPGLNNALSSYQSTLSRLAPAQVGSFDAQQALSGQTVSLDTGTYTTATTFAQATSQLLVHLNNIAATPGDAASGVAADLAAAIGSALSSTYVINTGYALPNSIGSYGFDPTTPGAHVLDGSAIGLTQTGNSATLDTSTLQSAYATDPFATTALLNTVIAAVGHAVGAFAGANGLAAQQATGTPVTSTVSPPFVNPSDNSAYLSAANAYQLASSLL
jgi:hypothetical protein